MKGMKGRFLRKLKSISTLTSLRQGIIFHAPTVIVSEVVNQEKDEEIDPTFHECEKENLADENPEIPIPLESGNTYPCPVPLPAEKSMKESETCGFQPNPFVIMEHQTTDKAKEEREGFLRRLDFEESCPPGGSERVIQKAKEERKELPTLLGFEENYPPGGSEQVIQKAKGEREEFPTLWEFEEKCPPGGSERVILYTTSMTGIRKTFENCNSVRFLLESFRVLYHERDVSMHLEFREELWQILGGRVVPPRLFIKGRHIGGADEVVGLHERGRLRNLLHGIPLNLANSPPCSGCGGVRFLVCLKCNGSRKVILDELTGEFSTTRCPECNENGLVKCPICC